MNINHSNINMEYINPKNQYFFYSKTLVECFTNIKINMIIILCIFYLFLIFYKSEFNNNNLLNSNKKIDFDKYETFKFDEIKEKLTSTNCSQMWGNQREFINGLIRKFKPKKILEVGVYLGGGSIVILNSIDDIKDSKLFSIDLDSKDSVGECVNKYFPNFLKNWVLFKGNISTEFMEKIGNHIDMVLFDTSHLEPGEIIDFLIVLPFLKEEAIVVFHDIANQILTHSRNEWAPYIIYNGIRGQKYLPSGNVILKQNIGAVKLEKNQKRFYQDYFRLLGGQWQYFPKEIHISLIRNYFKKYYGKECLIMFEEAIDFNRDFVKQNPKPIIYNITSD